MHNQPRETMDAGRLADRLADEVEARKIAERRARNFEAQAIQLRAKLTALSRLKPDPVDSSADGATGPRRRNHW